MKYIFFPLLLLSFSAFAKDSFLDSVERMKWGDLDVVWIEDNKFPKFTASIYFQDGALRDQVPGLTQTTFDLMSAGTSTQSQRELAEFFDFYGADLRHTVTHEYSVFSVQGLTRDIAPVMGKVCEMFKDAQYPVNEFNSHVSRMKSHLKNLVTSHSSLADRIFRNVSLANSPYAAPMEGTLVSFDKMKSTGLKERLGQLNRAKKVLYLAGPKDIMSMEKVLTKKCQWSNETSIEAVSFDRASSQSSIYLVPVPGANQAQIRIGRYLTRDEVGNRFDQYQFLAGFMGGSFTSKLVQELRVKRGLTYSAGAYVSIQRDYGRAGVTTFSKNETTAEAISLIRDIFAEVGAGKISSKEFEHQQSHQIGGYAFGFEETTAFLGQIMLYDHQRRNLSELANFQDNIKALKVSDLASADLEAFPWERMTIVVVGDKSLEKTLSKIRPVKVLNYQDFL